MKGTITACDNQIASNKITNSIINEFEKIAAIPRTSGHEEDICDYLEKWTKNRKFDVVRDEYNNLVFDVPATNGMENKPMVALQCHMDMVFAQEGDSLDPLTTSINVINDGKFLKTDGTSLGGDNGIGLSVVLCIVEGKMAHGPLRVFITTDEEVGLTGAENLDSVLFNDLEYLINVDWEIEGQICTSSAADKNYEYSLEGAPQKPVEDSAIRIVIDKLERVTQGQI